MNASLHTAPSAKAGGSLVRQAMQAVTRHIREQNLRVGDTVPGEGHFATALGVSRPVMREAFGALAALNLIEVANGRKPRVAAVDGSVIAASLDHAVSTAQVSVAEVWDVRRTLEVRTASLAAEHRTDAEAARLLALVEAMDQTMSDLGETTLHDIDFHQLIAEASRNGLFHQIVSSFAPLMEVAVPTAWRTRETEDQRITILERHRAVAQAIADRDPEAARQAMEAHFDASIGHILAGMAR
jgi:GntR family transcriptional regulator, transcriptional repressor for pyruvate dehydrogenase complex